MTPPAIPSQKSRTRIFLPTAGALALAFSFLAFPQLPGSLASPDSFAATAFFSGHPFAWGGIGATGPLAFLAANAFGAGHALAQICWEIGCALFLAAAAIAALAGLPRGRRAAAGALLLVSFALPRESLCWAVALLLGLRLPDQRRPADEAGACALSVALGFLGLIDFGLLVFGLAAVLASVATGWRRPFQSGLAAGAFVLTFATGWSLFLGGPGDFVRCAAHGWERWTRVSGGFSGLGGGEFILTAIALGAFLIASLAVQRARALPLLVASGGWALAAAAGLAATAQQAGLLWLAALLVVVTFPDAGGAAARAALRVTQVLGAVALAVALIGGWRLSAAGLPPAARRLTHGWKEFGAVLAHPVRFERRVLAPAWAAVRAPVPLPRLRAEAGDAVIDVLGAWPAAGTANRFNFQPGSLTSGRADAVLVRWPEPGGPADAADFSSPAWTRLVNGYVPLLDESGVAYWQRARRGAEPPPAPVRVRRSLAVGETLDLAFLQERPWSLSVRLPLNAAGIGALLTGRVPPAQLELTLSNGSTRRLTLPWGTQGRTLPLGAWLIAEGDGEFPAVKLRLLPATPSQRFYAAQVRLDFTLEPAQAALRGDGFQPVLPSEEGDFTQIASFLSLPRTSANYVMDGAVTTRMALPCRMEFYLPAADSLAVTGRFGIPPDVYPRLTDGRAVRVEAVWQTTTERQLLFTRTLDPVWQAADRGLQNFKAQVPASGQGRLILTARIQGDPAAGVIAWTALKITHSDEARVTTLINYPVLWRDTDAQAFPAYATSFTMLSGLMIDGQRVLLAHAPSTLVFAKPRHLLRARGVFGFDPGAYGPNGHTAGAEFSILWRSGHGAEKTLLRRALDPKSVAADRGLFPYDLDLGGLGDGLLVFKTAPLSGRNNSWGWTVWGGFDLRYAPPAPPLAQRMSNLANALQAGFDPLPSHLSAAGPATLVKVGVKPMLALPARAEAVLAVRADALSVGGLFGVPEAAWRRGEPAAGADFDVLWRDDAGEALLFHRHLDPVRDAADRGPQAFQIDLSVRGDGLLILRSDPRPEANTECGWGEVKVRYP